MARESTTVDLGEPTTVTKSSSHVVTDHKKKGFVAATAGGGTKRGMGIFDFILRLAAIGTTIGAASVMFNAQQTLPFTTQFIQFSAGYDDLPTFPFFVVAIAAVAGYLVLSLPISIVTIVRPHAVAPRMTLLIFDIMALTLETAAASGSAAVVYLAHTGNAKTNWFPVCQQFGDFCQLTSTAVVSAVIAVGFFIVLVANSAIALKRH